MNIRLKYSLFLCTLITLFSMYHCGKQSQEIPIKNEENKFDELVFAVKLINDSTRISEYLKYHEAVWPEMEAGFKSAGFQSIKLYRTANLVTMILKIPKGADLGIMSKSAEDHHPRNKEWNKLMSEYQMGLPHVEEGQT